MRTGTAGRTLAALAMGTALAGGTGVAAAAPGDGQGSTLTTLGRASTFLQSGGTGGPAASGDLTVFAPEGVAAFARGEFSVAGYDCLPQQSGEDVSSVPGAVDGVVSARAAGVFTLTCDYHVAPGEPDPGLPSLTATAVVDLTWAGSGPVERSTRAGGSFSCVTRAETRAAVVTGAVRVTVPGLPGGGGEVVLTAAGSAADALAHQQDRCRPARG
jgi:hypothetical protein